MTSLSRQVAQAQRAIAREQRDQQQAELERQFQQEQDAIEVSMSQARAQRSAAVQANQQNLVDARVQQVNALTEAINLRQQADNLRFNTAQDTIAQRTAMEVEQGQVAQQATQAQRQQAQQASQLGASAADRITADAGRGGTSSQTDATIRGEFGAMARQNAQTNRETSGLQSRLNSQRTYADRVLNLQNRLAGVQAEGIEIQAGVQEELSTTVARENIATAERNIQAARDAGTNSQLDLMRARSQSRENYAQALQATEQEYRQTRRNIRRGIV